MGNSDHKAQVWRRKGSKVSRGLGGVKCKDRMQARVTREVKARDREEQDDGTLSLLPERTRKPPASLTAPTW